MWQRGASAPADSEIHDVCVGFAAARCEGAFSVEDRRPGTGVGEPDSTLMLLCLP